VTPLEVRLRDRIARAGPITVHDYMAAAAAAYYAGRDPFGAAGDFVTAPEISQMFGELIGAWMAHAWAAQGRPSRVVLAELGPGRGALMADALRALRAAPGFLAAADLWLVETSAALRRAQAARLGGFAPRWAARIDELPAGPLFLVANEVIDALPIRQYRRADPGWQERRVDLVQGRLAFGFAPIRLDAGLDARFPLLPDGVIVEVNPGGEAIARDVGARIAAAGGAALIVDYGAWDGTGDTLQALRRHAPVDPLGAPGEADLTAHVRFRALAEAAAPARAFGPAPQGAFLARLGIGARAARLAAGRTPEVAAAVAGQLRRLTDPAEMGTLFRAMAVMPADAAPPPGFEADDPQGADA
jgi:NADH dehydrogenase [ubiquinone] 1 alpha subcomplex assembly factor 7